jgi:argininosuccinate lyase
MAGLMLANISVKENLLQDEKYKFLFSVEEVNKLVLQGIPFRDAYKQVGLAIEAGKFTYSTDLQHTHEGSIGNLCTAEVKEKMERVLKQFPFEKTAAAEAKLLGRKI